MTTTAAARSVTPLATISRITTAGWQALRSETSSRNTSGITALQPQPLPPLERFQVAAAEMAHEFARLAIEADITGRSGSAIISEFVDDWCGTPWPHHWPIPAPHLGPEPHPRPNEGPVPDPWVIQSGRMVGALVLADIGSRLGGGALRDSLLSGSERLFNAAGQP